MALQVLRAARNVGLHIPEDLSLVGFDDMDVVSQIDPPLTTVRQDPTQIGASAAQRLLDLIERGAARERITLLPTRLIVRDSTAPPPDK